MARCCCRDCCCGAGEGCCISEETTTLGPVFYAAWSLVAFACFVGNLIYPVENMCGFVARPVAVMWSYSVWSIPAAAFVISVVCLLFYGLFYGLLFFVCCCRKPTKCNIGDAGLYLAFFALVVFVWLTVVFPISFVFFPSFMVYVVFSSGGGGVEYLPLLCISFAILVFFWPMVVELLGSNFKNLSKSPNPVFHACRQCGIAPECFPQRKDKIRKVRRCRLCVLACILLLHIASGLAAAYVGLVKDAADGCRNCNDFVASQVTTTAATSYCGSSNTILPTAASKRYGTMEDYNTNMVNYTSLTDGRLAWLSSLALFQECKDVCGRSAAAGTLPFGFQIQHNEESFQQGCTCLRETCVPEAGPGDWEAFTFICNDN